MSSHDAWIDLLAANAVDPRMSGPVVAVHTAQRSLPLLESRVPLVWLHTRTPPWRDFHASPNCLPQARERLDGRRDPVAAQRLLQRAAMVVLAVPMDPREMNRLLPLLQALPEDRPLIVHGPRTAEGWAVLAAWPRLAGLVSLSATGWLARVSPAVLARLEHAGTGGVLPLGPSLAQQLVARLPRQLGVHLDLATASGHPRLRIRPHPVQCIATASLATEHQIVVDNRALFNARGMATLLLPWDGGAMVRLLLRNVRARVDNCVVACGSDELRPSTIDYTDAGAVLSLRAPAVAADRDTLLHLSLPRAAVPEDGFCDVGAVEFNVDLA